jgi:hypothetical protein
VSFEKMLFVIDFFFCTYSNKKQIDVNIYSKYIIDNDEIVNEERKGRLECISFGIQMTNRK